MRDKATSLLLFTAIVSLFVNQAFAQSLIDNDGPRSTKENSPYSRYGIGNLKDVQSAPIQGMGKAATAFIDPFSINSYNPASYSFLTATALDFGLQGSSNRVFLGNKNYSSGTVTFSYLALGVPIKKNAGLAFGFKPLSTMYYNASDTLAAKDEGKSLSSHSGNGGMQLAYFGGAYKFKGLSLGLSLGYAFGTFDYMNAYSPIVPDSGITAFRHSQFMKSDQIGGLYWRGGLQYRLKFKKDHFLNFGSTVTLPQTLNLNRESYGIATTVVGNQVLSRDTLNKTENMKGSVTMPAEYSIGLFVGKEFNWSLGFDFSYNDWSKFEKMAERMGVADDAYRLSIGGDFTPNPNASNKKYLSLVTYRLGAYYGKGNLRLNNTDVDYLGATVGASFPLKKQFTQFGRIHTILDLGKRGTTENGLAREFYVRFTFGLSLNDVWFIRPKYN